MRAASRVGLAYLSGSGAKQVQVGGQDVPPAALTVSRMLLSQRRASAWLVRKSAKERAAEVLASGPGSIGFDVAGLISVIGVDGANRFDGVHGKP